MDTDDTWRDAIAGEGDDAPARMEALQAFDNPAALFDSQQQLSNANWRDAFVPEDDKDEFAKTMERFNAPADFGKSFREAQSMLSANKQAVPLGDDATDEDILNYRTVNELPLEPKDYLENLPDGLVLGEDDLGAAEIYMTALHGQMAPKKYGDALLTAYAQAEEQRQTAEVEMDTAHQAETNDTLRADWGSDYRANINVVHSWLEGTFGTEVKEQLLHGRYQDGRGFMNDPAILKGLATVARAANPLAPIIPQTGDPVTTLHDEIAKIEGIMRTDRPAYNKDQKMQDRLVELYDIRLKHEKSAA